MLSKETYKKALERMDELLVVVGNETNPDSPEFKELNILSDKIADYEEKHYSFEPKNLKEMLELKMYQRKLKQKDLALLLNTTPSRISEIMNGKRQLTFELAKALHQKLQIDAEFLLKC